MVASSLYRRCTASRRCRSRWERRRWEWHRSDSSRCRSTVWPGNRDLPATWPRTSGRRGSFGTSSDSFLSYVAASSEASIPALVTLAPPSIVLSAMGRDPPSTSCVHRSNVDTSTPWSIRIQRYPHRSPQTLILATPFRYGLLRWGWVEMRGLGRDGGIQGRTEVSRPGAGPYSPHARPRTAALYCVALFKLDNSYPGNSNVRQLAKVCPNCGSGLVSLCSLPPLPSPARQVSRQIKALLGCRSRHEAHAYGSWICQL
jgi:hypothetical protein